MDSDICFNLGFERILVAWQDARNGLFAFCVVFKVGAANAVALRSTYFSLREAITVKFQTFRFLAVAPQTWFLRRLIVLLDHARSNSQIFRCLLKLQLLLEWFLNRSWKWNVQWNLATLWDLRLAFWIYEHLAMCALLADLVAFAVDKVVRMAAHLVLHKAFFELFRKVMLLVGWVGFVRHVELSVSLRRVHVAVISMCTERDVDFWIYDVPLGKVQPHVLVIFRAERVGIKFLRQFRSWNIHEFVPIIFGHFCLMWRTIKRFIVL